MARYKADEQLIRGSYLLQRSNLLAFILNPQTSVQMSLQKMSFSPKSL